VSKRGIVAAREHAQQLPSFGTLSEARERLLARRDQDIAVLRRAAERSARFTLDFTADSLKGLEQWYFQLIETGSFETAGLTRMDFERCVPAYFGEVLVRTCPPFEWVVEEYAFASGKYELGVRRQLVTVMLTVPWDLSVRPNNRRRQSLWREYHQHAA
jgi:hypothetical protein